MITLRSSAYLVLLASMAYGTPLRIPLSFERNAGQTGPEAKYLARAEGRLLYFSERDVVFRFAGKNGSAVALRMEMMGASQRPAIEALDQQHISAIICKDRTPRTGTPISRSSGVCAIRGSIPASI